MLFSIFRFYSKYRNCTKTTPAPLAADGGGGGGGGGANAHQQQIDALEMAEDDIKGSGGAGFVGGTGEEIGGKEHAVVAVAKHGTAGEGEGCDFF